MSAQTATTVVTDVAEIEPVDSDRPRANKVSPNFPKATLL